jgi:hypothetical protein
MKNKENVEKLKTKDNFGIAFEILNEKQRKMKKINKDEENLKEKKLTSVSSGGSANCLLKRRLDY